MGVIGAWEDVALYVFPPTLVIEDRSPLGVDLARAYAHPHTN